MRLLASWRARRRAAVVTPDEVHEVRGPQVRPLHTRGAGAIARAVPTLAARIAVPRRSTESLPATTVRVER